MSKINVLRSLGILFISALCLSACSPEEYGPCSIPNTKAHAVACSPMGNSATATCAADFVFDCDSLICGIYQSSDPFCTHRCVPTEKECTSDDLGATVETDDIYDSFTDEHPEGETTDIFDLGLDSDNYGDDDFGDE